MAPDFEAGGAVLMWYSIVFFLGWIVGILFLRLLERYFNDERKPRQRTYRNYRELWDLPPYGPGREAFELHRDSQEHE